MLKLISTILFLFISCQAGATTYYVRDGGGSVYSTSAGTNKCNGQTNSVYTSGDSPNCALNHPRLVLGYCTGNEGSYPPCQVTGIMSGGDTLYIDGDSDLSPGNQAQYMTGYDDSGSTTPSCNSSFKYACRLGPIPGGSSESPTIVEGTGTHKPQLWGDDRTSAVVWLHTDYVNLDWLEITDHEACAYNDPNSGCSGSPAYDDGILSDNSTGNGYIFTDIYIHGFSRFGFIVTGSLGTDTFTRTYVIGNGFGGITIGNDTSSAVTGTLTWNQPIIEWNGCIESYPLTYSGIDNPLNYSNCFGQESGGYGDGLAFGPSVGNNAGNWNIYGPGSISFNTQDGFDTLHGNGNGTIQIDKMRFEGNAGQQIKLNATINTVTNSLIVGDCGWWYGAAQSGSGAMQAGDTCRASGDTTLFNVTNGSVLTLYNNTIISNGSVALESKDLGSTGCNESTVEYVYNNLVYGGYAWWDDTTWNGSGGNSQATYIYNDGNDGDGGGTCGNITWTEDYNIVDQFKNSNAGCNGTHDKCGTSPGFISGIFPTGSSGGAASTFYQGTSGITLLPLASNSAAVGSGVGSLSYWNTSNDYYNNAITSPPVIGALNYKSSAANGWGCFYNSDCSSNSCVSNVCTASGGGGSNPVLSISGSMSMQGLINYY